MPENFFNLNSRNLWAAFGAPTLISLQGERTPALFVSCMIHGNEFSGLIGVQQLLQNWLKNGRPRSLLIFIGNPEAAAHGLRQMPNGPDYNRIWSADYKGPEATLAAQLQEFVNHAGIFAAIDIHNNSGKNPTYSCIHQQDDLTLRLAHLFSPRLLFINGRIDTLTAAMSRFAPAITVECGLPGDKEGLISLEFLFNHLLSIDHGEKLPLVPFNLRPYEIFASIKIQQHTPFSFNSGYNQNTGIEFVSHLEDYNFKSINSDVVWARLLNPDFFEQFSVVDLSGKTTTDSYFKMVNQSLLTKIELMPAMLTTHPEIVRSDCLGYLVRKMP